MPLRVLILAGDSDGNLGDRAILMATCDAMRELEPGISVTVISSSRGPDNRYGPGVKAIAGGLLGLPALLRAARRSNLVIFGGGGLLQDDDSLAKIPYWALRLGMIRLSAGRIAGLSVGSGPIDHTFSRLCVRLILRLVEPMSVRDALARTALDGLGDRYVQVVPDPAFLLNAAPDEAARQVLAEAGVPADGTTLIGVAVRRWFHMNSDLVPHKFVANRKWRRNRGRKKMTLASRNIAKALDSVTEESSAHVVFMPTYNVAHEADIEACRGIAAHMRRGCHSFLMLEDPKLYKAVTARMRVMLCGRMHPAILAAGCGTPVIGLAYNQKFRGTFSLLGMKDRCLELPDFVDADAADTLTELLRQSVRTPEDWRPDTYDLQRRVEFFIAGLLDRASAERVFTRRRDPSRRDATP